MSCQLRISGTLYVKHTYTFLRPPVTSMGAVQLGATCKQQDTAKGYHSSRQKPRLTFMTDQEILTYVNTCEYHPVEQSSRGFDY